MHDMVERNETTDGTESADAREFEAFNRGMSVRGTRDERTLHISRRGIFCLSRKAYDLMGAPERVNLAYDRRSHIIRLTPADSGDETAYPLRRIHKGSSKVGFRSLEFLNHFDISHDRARIVPVRVEDAVAFAYLDEGEFAAERTAGVVGVVRSGGGLEEEAFPSIAAAYRWLKENTGETVTYLTLLKACHDKRSYKGFDWRTSQE